MVLCFTQTELPMLLILICSSHIFSSSNLSFIFSSLSWSLTMVCLVLASSDSSLSTLDWSWLLFASLTSHFSQMPGSIGDGDTSVIQPGTWPPVSLLVWTLPTILALLSLAALSWSLLLNIYHGWSWTLVGSWWMRWYCCWAAGMKPAVIVQLSMFSCLLLLLLEPILTDCVSKLYLAVLDTNGELPDIITVLSLSLWYPAIYECWCQWSSG